MKHVSPSPGSRSLHWFLASRPKTLGISLAPVVVASALLEKRSGPSFFDLRRAMLLLMAAGGAGDAGV